MRLRDTTILFVLLAGLAGCSSLAGTHGDSAGVWGSSFGAGGGSVANSEAGAAIAMLQGNEFGEALEASDRKAAAEAQRRALRSRGVGAAIAWNNEKTGRNGEVRPGPVYQVNKLTCREFTHEMVVDRKVLTARGTACKTENGGWRTLI